MIIRTSGHPRAGLVGNPSDGYFGKTIAFTFKNFRAEVMLYQTPELEILPNTRDHSRFSSIHALAKDVRLFGYYGGIRLLKAAVKRFHDYCTEHGIRLDDRNFTIRYHTDIPSQVGLAGSSAIITACMRALMNFYDVNIPKPILPNLILSVENKELGISAGLQDRVAQVYEGLIYMDFDQAIMDRQGHGLYEELDPALLPPLYVAYREDLSEGSWITHNVLRHRFNEGDPEVLAAMRFWADLTVKVRDALFQRRTGDIPALLNANFDRRRALYGRIGQAISPDNIAMVETARSVGASAKFSGSGGAIVGTYTDEAMFQRLGEALAAIHVKVIKPDIARPGKD
jgi:glucuronokinase